MRPIFRCLTLMTLGLAIAGAGTTPAPAEGRHALVIGIDAYRDITPLQKAVGDAEALKATLEDLGFTVDLVLDADRRALNRAVSEFQSKLAPGDTALIHFSGHGVELDGQNYLLPADIPSPKSGQQDFIKAEAISLGDLMQRVASSGAATRIFIVDACRDNPFAQAGSRGVGGTRGLTRVEAPAGTFVLYSAGYNQTALDRLNDADSEPTSVYTRVLTKKMAEPGKPLAELARDVRSDVEVLAKSAGHEQRPAYYDELSGQFFFKDGAAAPQALLEPAPGQPPTPQTAPVPQASLNERDAYGAAQGINTAAAWDAFLKRFPSGFYADMARAARDKIAREEAPPPPSPLLTPPPAESAGNLQQRLEAFVANDYLGGDLRSVAHLESIYAAQVDYWGKGRVPVATVVAEKLAYARKWPSLNYALKPGSLSFEPIEDSPGSFRVQFQYDFRVAKGAKAVEGTGQGNIVVDLSGPSPRITSESGGVLTRNGTAGRR
jgi:Caspase domain